MFEDLFSEQIKRTPTSFIREMLKVVSAKDIISFAGGLPNPSTFPQNELKTSLDRITSKYGTKLYQYYKTLGLDDLRQYIADKYNKKYNLNITQDNVIITTGSQQALDLISKVFINDGDEILIEAPAYLSFLQLCKTHNTTMLPVELTEDGLNIDDLKITLKNHNPKLAYLDPNFQNPTGILYPSENRKDIFELIKDKNIITIQDNPYGELYFDKKYQLDFIGQNQTDNNIYLGSFSKTIAPGLRIGYAIAHKDIIQKLEIAKQTSDLHSPVFNQYLIFDYLENNDIDNHLDKLRTLYKNQANTMITAMEKYFPDNIKFINPKGGMFTWVTIEENKNTLNLFNQSILQNVAFVPGEFFYTTSPKTNTMRLNYTNNNPEEIEKGIKILSDLIKNL